MSKQEISITDFELQDCKGNLAKLRSNWVEVPTVPSSTLATSHGKSASAVKDSLDATKQVSNAFDSLLENSLSFFDQMGIAFQESDANASQNIDSITYV